jgi:hypothetical protein
MITMLIWVLYLLKTDVDDGVNIAQIRFEMRFTQVKI